MLSPDANVNVQKGEYSWFKITGMTKRHSLNRVRKSAEITLIKMHHLSFQVMSKFQGWK